MFVGVGRYDLRLPGCSSLKDKRSVVRSLLSSLNQRFRCSVAEIDHQDLRQRTTVAVSVVSGTNFQARKVLNEVGRLVEGHPGVEVIGAFTDVMVPEE